jgi:gamma-aminobutyric acid type B receptor
MGTRSVEVLVDLYESGKKSLPHGENFFATKLISYSVIPVDLDKVFPPDYNSNLLGGLDYVGYIAFVIVVATATVCAAWSIINRKAMVVRAAQPFFLLVLISGILIFASTIIPLSFDDDGIPESMGERFPVGVCMAQPWLAFTGFTIIFSALFSKTWRVNRLFHSQQNFSRVQISVQDVLAPFAVIFSSNVIVLVCWTVIDPLTYQRLVGDGNDFWNRDIESYGACRSDKALAFLIPLALINFATLGVACWQVCSHDW